MEHAKEIIFWSVLGGVVIYDSLLFFSIAKPQFRFWPPPPVVGGLLFASGGAFALWGFFGLGVTASQGLGGPLLVGGAYRYSRNPQYVGTVVGLLGYGVICNSTFTLAAVVLWSSWYLLAPFAEEPWLRERLGTPFAEYAARVRRYL